MKTVQDYFNDPRLTSDKGLMSGPEEIKTIHAIRLKIQDETAGMSIEEQNLLSRKKTDAVFSSLGLPLPRYVNFEGQGRINKPAEVIDYA